MNQSEAGLVLAKCGAFDNRKPSPVVVQAWADSLDPSLPVGDALRFVTEHYAQSRDWIMPADLNRRWTEERRRRVSAVSLADYPPPPQDASPTEFLHMRQAFVEAIGAGHDVKTAAIVAHKSVGRTPPTLEPTQSRPVDFGHALKTTKEN